LPDLPNLADPMPKGLRPDGDREKPRYDTENNTRPDREPRRSSPQTPLVLDALEGEPPTVEEHPQQPTAATVGALLAQTRAAFGQSVEEVSSALRIRPVFLRAIEESRYQDMPGLTYGVGFVRSYAHYLGLDVSDCVERFKDEAAGIERTTNLNFPAPVPEAKVPTGAIILVSLLLASLAYLVWTYVSRDAQPPSEQVEQIAETPKTANAADTNTPVESEAAPPVATAATAQAAGTISASDATAEDGAKEVATARAVAKQTAINFDNPTAAASAGPEAAMEGQGSLLISNDAQISATTSGSAPILFTEAASAINPTAPTVDGSVAYSGPRVALRATQDSWVQVRNASNSSIFTRVLRAGDSYDVPNEPDLKLWTGNAGGLVITVDGQEIPKLGRSGQVRRNVSLDPTSLKSGG